MLIIFDLDDTLIDTSGALTPFKLKEALLYLQKQEPFFENFFTAYDELLTLNRTCGSAREALQSFLLQRSIHPERREGVLQTLKTPFPKDFFVPTTPNALAVLEHFKLLSDLAIVTYGNRAFQLEKLEKAGIDPSIFSKIVALEEGEKGAFYKELIKEFSLPVWVCGDRVERDLRPAYELGLKTVHMRWGRGVYEQGEKWIDETIRDLSELKGKIKW